MAKGFSLAQYGGSLKMYKQMEAMRRGTQRAREKAGELINGAVRTAEIGGTAFALGYMQGRIGPKAVFGVPVDLAVGVGAKVLAAMGVGGAEDHVNAIGDGAIACFAVTMGRGAGLKAEGKAETSGASLDDLAAF